MLLHALHVSGSCLFGGSILPVHLNVLNLQSRQMLLQRPRVPAPMRFAIMPGSSYWVSGPRRTSLVMPRHRVPTRDLPEADIRLGGRNPLASLRPIANSRLVAHRPVQSTAFYASKIERSPLDTSRRRQGPELISQSTRPRPRLLSTRS